MIYPEADKLESWGSKYALVTLAARRAKQIKSGAAPLIETTSRNPLTIALEEIAAGKVTCFVPEFDAVIEPTPEPELAELLAIPVDTDEEAEITDDTTTVIDDDASLLHDDEEEYTKDDDEEEVLDVWKVVIEPEADAAVVPVPALDIDQIELTDLAEDQAEPKKRGRHKKAEVEEDVISLDELEEETEFVEDEEAEEE